MMGFFLRKKNKERKRFFHENGRLMLEELISSSNGKSNPIRSFSSDQILQATNNFDWNRVVSVDRFVWYEGTIQNQRVLIRKSEYADYVPDNIHRDIAVSSLMSSHKNVLKLLACCLDFSLPVLVCEYAERGALAEREDHITPLTWHIRLKIAKEVASAVAYLHTMFPRTIIHRDIKLQNIFLDENWTAKLSSFCLSIPIPEGESGVLDIVCGTFGYVELDYLRTALVTENVDVYSFGIVMLVLLTGKPVIRRGGHPVLLPDYVGELAEEDRFGELVDPAMMNHGAQAPVSNDRRLQMEAFLRLALRCIRSRPGEDVPKMIEVAKELKQIERLVDASLPD